MGRVCIAALMAGTGNGLWRKQKSHLTGVNPKPSVNVTFGMLLWESKI